jgi:hypothetical protein
VKEAVDIVLHRNLLWALKHIIYLDVNNGSPIDLSTYSFMSADPALAGTSWLVSLRIKAT